MSAVITLDSGECTLSIHIDSDGRQADHASIVDLFPHTVETVVSRNLDAAMGRMIRTVMESSHLAATVDVGRELV